VDECLAVYGKFQSALGRRKEPSCEMFIDCTPGTPPIYRREALTKIWTIGYKLENNVLFGTDGTNRRYSPQAIAAMIAADDAIYDELALPSEIRQKIYHHNLLRWLGKA
jgi:hypothetical protein